MATWLWVGFTLLLAVLLFIDLGVLNRKAHVISAKEALQQAGFWAVLALCFNAGIYFLYEHHVGGLGIYPEHGPAVVAATPSGGESAAAAASSPHAAALPRNGNQAAVMWFTCYIVEQSLSLDNMLVIALIMGYFRIPKIYQHRVLFWGIVGAIVLRGSMIVVGTALIKEFEWVIYILAGVLLFSAVKMLMAKEEEHQNLEHNAVVKWTKKLFLVAEHFDGPRFLTRVPVGDDGKPILTRLADEPPAGTDPATASRTIAQTTRRAITPLLLALIVIDIADAAFAIDSIPAAFGITLDSYIVFTSNMFAILGLRAMFFALAAALDKFKYLKLSMIFVLLVIAIKMILSQATGWHVSPWTSLGIIAGIMLVGVLASLKGLQKPPEGFTRELADLAETGLIRAKRITLIGIGMIIVLAGLVMTIPGMPGPGLLIIPIGLAILGAEFTWARYLQKKYIESAAAAGKFAGDTLVQKPRPWLIPAGIGALIAASLAAHYYLPGFKHRDAVILASIIGSVIGMGLWAYENVVRYWRVVEERGVVFADQARPPVWLGIVALVVVAVGSLALYRYDYGASGWRAVYIGGWATLGVLGSLVWLILSARAEREAGPAPLPKPRTGPASGASLNGSGAPASSPSSTVEPAVKPTDLSASSPVAGAKASATEP